MCYGRLGHLFPYLPKQPGYHKRIKAAAPLICLHHHAVPGHVVPLVVRRPAAAGRDPVPCGASRQTVRRSALAGLAGYGYCTAHSRWYRDLKLYLITTAEGMPVAWFLADPKLGEREVAAGLLDLARDTGALREGMIVLADKGLAGRELERYAAGEVKVLLVRPDRKDERYRYGNPGGMRQWAESVYDTAKDQLAFERHGARTAAGVFARIAQRLLALGACIWHNWSIRTTDLRSLIAYDH